MSYNNRDKVKVVVMDMSTLFRSMAKQCFPNATIVADKYHVIRQVCWAFEAVRKEEQKKHCDEGRLLFKTIGYGLSVKAVIFKAYALRKPRRSPAIIKALDTGGPA